ncbi:MAG: hypothetical protein FJ304_27575 [Planctomycetes bacterium]|nr:hypothetical protein [Planctomycetota bacterium]
MAFNKDDAAAMFREADPTLTEEQIQTLAKATIVRIAAHHSAAVARAKSDVRRATDADRSEATRLRSAAAAQRLEADALLVEARDLQAKAQATADHATVLAAAVAEDPRIGLADYYIRDVWRRAESGDVTSDQACRTTGMIVAAALGGLDMDALACAQKATKKAAKESSAPSGPASGPKNGQSGSGVRLPRGV